MTDGPSLATTLAALAAEYGATPQEWESLEWRLDHLYQIVDKSGKKIPLRLNDAQRAFVRRIGPRNLILKARQLGFCLDPATRVLTADLRWVPIAEVQPGAELVAVDEGVPGGRGASRKMRTTTVVAARTVSEPGYRITFEDGRSVVCTGQHRWLSRKTMTQAEWRMVDNGKASLKVGTNVRWVTSPWNEIGTPDDYWFGGMLDGEGSLAKPSRSGASLNVSQREGPVWERLVRYAAERGYSYRIEGDAAERPSKHGRVPVPKVVFTRMDELFRLIGQTRPTRFVGRHWWDGKDLPGKRSGEGWATIASIEPVPPQAMVDMQTTAGTFIAEGFVSHNSTLVEIIQLDQALFNPNHTGVVIADTLPNAGKLFKKIEFAYEHLNDILKAASPLDSKNSGSSITFAHQDANGVRHPSSISVGVSSRGGTPQMLHVSELGKISLKYPQRADEIKTGALPSVPLDGTAIIESTAEGAFGLFYDLCEPAMKRAELGQQETQLDWRLHFFPWFEAKEYRLSDEDTALVPISPDLRRYFARLEAELRITIDANQRAWYAKTLETLGKKMKQEYPSTPKEAFEQAIEGAIYGDQMTYLREQRRIVEHVPLDPNYPVDTVWDFGVAADAKTGNGTNSIWFHQQVGLQHRWFYYTSGFGKGLRYWWIEVCEEHRKRHGYRWGQHFLPHDADAEILGEVVTTKHRILAELGMENIVVVPRVANIDTGIELVRKGIVGNHWFNSRMADPEKGEDMGAGAGIKGLDGYQYEWDDKRGVWSNKPLHNWASHPSDAIRQWFQALENGMVDQSPEERKAQRDEDYEDDYARRRRRNWKVA